MNRHQIHKIQQRNLNPSKLVIMYTVISQIELVSVYMLLLVSSYFLTVQDPLLKSLWIIATCTVAIIIALDRVITTPLRSKMYKTNVHCTLRWLTYSRPGA